ncbi:MAG: hypothetical protein LAT51_03360 [Flavobacteriaceae bacterium]|nr:hypothetical protein [Flavobacteriaceae bacterium]
MKLILFISFFTLFAFENPSKTNCSTFKNQFSTIVIQEEIRIHVNSDKVVSIYDNEVEIEEISKIINDKIGRYDDESALSMNVSIVVDAIVSEDYINQIKEQIKKTPIRLVNVQRSIVENYSPNGQLTEQLINQYNSLIKNWNELDDSQRYYRQIELNFVESVNQRMSLRQKLKAERLPGYLPFVAHPQPQTEISQQQIEKWSKSSNVRLFLNKKNISQTEFNELNKSEIKSYYLIKLIENEEKIQEVYLQN